MGIDKVHYQKVNSDGNYYIICGESGGGYEITLKRESVTCLICVEYIDIK